MNLFWAEIYGKRPNKIVNGTDAAITEFPGVVSIQNWGYHFCGGVLITKRHVLTAAHCLTNVDGTSKLVRLLDKDAFTVATGSSNCQKPQHVYNIEKFDIYPHYTVRPPQVYNDIGIITVSNDESLMLIIAQKNDFLEQVKIFFCVLLENVCLLKYFLDSTTFFSVVLTLINSKG